MFTYIRPVAPVQYCLPKQSLGWPLPSLWQRVDKIVEIKKEGKKREEKKWDTEIVVSLG